MPILANVFVSGAAVGSGKMNFIKIPSEFKIKRFKEMIYDRTGDNPETIRLIYGGKELAVSRGGTGKFKRARRRTECLTKLQR